jgi:hypothetical protein
MSQIFDIARAQTDLIIQLSIPYARYQSLDVYQTSVFATPVPGKHSFTTTLQSFPKYLIGDPDSQLWGEIEQIPAASVIDMFDVKWVRSQTKSCTQAIMTDDAAKARDQCAFVVKQETIPSSLLRSATGIYVASNLTSIQVQCPSHRSTPTTEPCTPCVVHLDCNCTLYDQGKLILKEMQGCHWDGPASTTILHPINLALLQQFYETGNESLSAKLLLNPSDVKQPAALHLSMFGNNVSQILAADKTDGYLLAKVAESLKNESVIYHSPTDALLNDVIRSMMRPMLFLSLDSNFAMVIGSYILIAALAIICYRLRQQVALLTLATPIVLAAKAQAYELRSEFLSTTFSPGIERNMSRIINDLVKDVRHIDMAYITMMTLLIIIIITTSCMIIGIKRALTALGRYSYLYIEITAGSQCHQLRFATLPDASRNTVVRVPRTALQFQLANYFIFAVITLTPRAPKIVNTLTRKRTQLRNIALIAPWTVSKIRQLTEANVYTITPMVANTHEYAFLEQGQLLPTAPDFI